MAHAAHATHESTPDPAAGASVRLHAVDRLAADVVAARDELFRDADRHGPRSRVIARHAAVAAAVLPLVLAVDLAGPWRSALVHHLVARAADLALIAPMLAALVFAASLLAPLARISAWPLAASAVALLAPSVWLTSRGDLVAATVPLALGGLVLGIAFARVMRRAVWALPVLLAAGISDAQSVQGGVTRELLGELGGGGHSSAAARAVTSVDPSNVVSIDFLLMHVPVASGVWMLGFVDVLAVGLLLGLTHLFWLPMRRTALALGIALVVTAGLGGPVPVLPALGAAWVLANLELVWRSTRFSLRRLTYLGG
ncbi:MAG: hypothetical protein JWN41_821 [Thermoleophilia bacterium]|nr:hypothetical protein [Thermoleophilia bacterium]